MFLVIYITFPDRDSAQRITRQLIEERLVACANVFPMSSTYWWQAQVESADEWVGIVKTVPANREAVERSVIALHPYDVPCIMHWAVSANADYETWIETETRQT